jgi:hypothetical protein
MSLDAAEIDLRNAFTYGQGYVALSRVRSLSGMKVIGLNSQALLVDPRVVHKDEHFREESDDAEFVFNEMEEEEILKMQKSFVSASGGKWNDGTSEVRERRTSIPPKGKYLRSDEGARTQEYECKCYCEGTKDGTLDHLDTY